MTSRRNGDDVIDWPQIFRGAALTAVIALPVLVLLRRERRPAALAAALLASLAGPVAWNAILHGVGGREFFVDAPVAVFPVSWQDTGSGVFTLAVSALILGVVLRRDRAGAVLATAATLAVVAL